MSAIKSGIKALGDKYHQHFGVQDFDQIHGTVSAWFGSGPGQQLLESEQLVLDQLMPEIFGYHLMQLSVCPSARLSEKSMASHHFSLFPAVQPEAAALSRFESLPIESESLDAVLVHHALEFSSSPHQLLREVSRTLIPNGFVVIIGFNPLSTWQIRKQFGRFVKRSPQWRYRNLFRSRVVDWLQVLDFEIALKQNGFFTPPFGLPVKGGIENILARVAPFSGAFYIIAARKSVVPLQLHKPVWKKRRALGQWAPNPALSSKVP